MRARTFWLKAHLYLALTLGAFLAILGLTGTLLVFHPEIDRLIVPAPRVAQSGVAPLSPDAIVALAERKLSSPVGLLRFPTTDSPVFRLESFDAQIDRYRVIDVDSRDGTILANRIWGSTLVTLLFDVHTKLLLGEAGLTVVGILGIVFLVSIATGLYLWWPRASGWWRALTFRRGRGWLSLNFEAHRLTGIYFALVLAIVAASGVYITLPGPFIAVVELVADVSAEPQAVLSRPAPRDAARVTLNEVERSLRAAAPGARLRSIVMPDGRADSYSVQFVERGAPDNYYGESVLWIDQFTGRILEARLYSQLGRGERFLALQLPLHDGQYLGLGGRIMVFLGGIATCLMYGTGLYLWWKRRRRPG